MTGIVNCECSDGDGHGIAHNNLVEAPVKPANGGQIYLLYKRLLGYSDMTPILVAVFAGVEKALDEKYKLQKDDHANSYFIEDSRLSV